MALEVHAVQGYLPAYHDVVVLPIYVLRAVYDSFESIVGEEGAGLLAVMGRAIGRAIAGGHSVRESLAILESLGLGRVVDVEVEKSEIIVRVEDTVSSRVIRESRKPVCHLERGVVSGIVEAVLGAKCVARESECRACGASLCEFRLQVVG